MQPASLARVPTSAVQVSRFAPSTTGRAHPGTLLAGLLAWLDARARGARLLLRLEDLDPERCRPEWSVRMREDLAWLGLDFDADEEQHDAAARHAAALDRLAALGVLYPCACSRSLLRAESDAALGRGARYTNRCRGRPLPAAGWRTASEPLRVALPSGRIAPLDEGGRDLAQDPAEEMGDPIVRRRDGAVAYQLAVVVDDAASGVTRVVRGHDLAASTATQIALQRLLGLPEPVYRHHLLLLEERGEKLAKLHGAVGADALRAVYTAPALTGFLAHAAGLRPDATPLTLAALVPAFDWTRVARADRVVRWTGSALELIPRPD
jgi:glutamyl/glutaminyl-tRNA synthetase